MKLNKILLATSVLAAASVGGFINPALADTPASSASVVVVNYEALVHSSQAFKAASDEFQKKFSAQNDELQKRQADLQKEDKDLAAFKAKFDADLAGGKLLGAELKKRESDFKARSEKFSEKLRKFQEDTAAFQKETQDYQQASLAKVERSIQDFVAKYAKDNKIQLVISSQAAVYYSNAVDITNALIEKVK